MIALWPSVSSAVHRVPDPSAARNVGAPRFSSESLRHRPAELGGEVVELGGTWQSLVRRRAHDGGGGLTRRES